MSFTTDYKSSLSHRVYIRLDRREYNRTGIRFKRLGNSRFDRSFRRSGGYYYRYALRYARTNRNLLHSRCWNVRVKGARRIVLTTRVYSSDRGILFRFFRFLQLRFRICAVKRFLINGCTPRCRIVTTWKRYLIKYVLL